MLNPFGHALRDARLRRGWSQLDLAIRARSTARHVSCPATGRSRPSAEMVLRLARELDVPLRQRNQLLRAAGHPPAYAERPLDDATLGPVRAVIDRMLAAHEPFPAYVVDARWRFVTGNRGGAWLWDALGAGHDRNVLLALLDSPLGARLDNPHEVAWQAHETLQRDALATGDATLLAELAALSARLTGAPPAPVGPVVAARARLGDQVLSLITTVCRLGNAAAVTTDELRVELVFPGDAATEAALTALAAAGPGAVDAEGSPRYTGA